MHAIPGVGTGGNTAPGTATEPAGGGLEPGSVIADLPAALGNHVSRGTGALDWPQSDGSQQDQDQGSRDDRLPGEGVCRRVKPRCPPPNAGNGFGWILRTADADWLTVEFHFRLLGLWHRFA
jgi:hypothetical protein